MQATARGLPFVKGSICPLVARFIHHFLHFSFKNAGRVPDAYRLPAELARVACQFGHGGAPAGRRHYSAGSFTQTVVKCNWHIDPFGATACFVLALDML